jgi:hypothetical protein
LKSNGRFKYLLKEEDVSRPNEKYSPRYQFQFRDVGADPHLEKNANLRLVQLLALAPPDASALGLLEKNDQYYVSTVEVQSRYRTFHEKAAGTTPDLAVKRALEKLEDRLYRWRAGSGGASRVAA